ncbi:MAG: hypothetical protein M3357_11675 [Actinomycetota bacterium]|nr:hypothetical protein [Actinomycetota bacterium]
MTAERELEVIAHVAASPRFVISILVTEPAGVLTGTPSVDRERFVAELAVEIGGGTSFAHEVDVTFGPLPAERAPGRFAISWRARDHQGAFPVFVGHLDVEPDGNGSRLCLQGRYSLPLGAVGAAGDRLLGHRVARSSIRGLLQAAAGRIDAMRVRERTEAPVFPRPADVAVIEHMPTELYLG